MVLWCWWWLYRVIVLQSGLVALHIHAQLSWDLPNHSPGDSLWFSLFDSPLFYISLVLSFHLLCFDKRASPVVLLKKRRHDFDFFGDLESFIIFKNLVSGLAEYRIPGLQSFRKYCFLPTSCCYTAGEVLLAGLLYEEPKAACSWSWCDLLLLWKLIGSSLCFCCDEVSWWCALTWVCFIHLAGHMMDHFNLETCVLEL